MLIYKGIINAFQNTLENFEFDKSKTFSEDFAQNRFQKKLERPDSSVVTQLSSNCWSEWLSNDIGLPDICLPPGKWYEARMFLHRNMLPLRFNEFQFPKGTEFIPTSGANSIEARLCQSRWTCTSDNFDRMAAVCYSHKALRRAVRNRYNVWFCQKDFDISKRQADSYLYRRFSASKRVGFSIFSWKLSRLVSITNGSRFSTVPKNNTSRRPINIEPFGNILTQRAVGIELRRQIQHLFGVDLDTLAQTHRILIKDTDRIATIDLKNASDSISLELCRFLLPKNLFDIILETRSSMVLGPDGSYHLTKKVSSMGNGFTFELISLILMSVCRTLDPTSTVFGDDIIIDASKASELIDLLTSVGLRVNEEKSFIDGPFRESCGANYHKFEGYIESYDFMWPETIGDCVLVWNKVVRLAPLYESFSALKQVLFRSIPVALRGGPSYEFEKFETLELVGLGNPHLYNEDLEQDVSAVFPLFFVTPRRSGKTVSDVIANALRALDYDPRDFRLIPGFEFKSELRSATLKHLHSSRWAKYEMYLHSNRRCKDVITNAGEWKNIWFVTSGTRTFRASALIT